MTSERFDQILEVLKQNGGATAQPDEKIREILLQNGVPSEEVQEFLDEVMEATVRYLHENSLGVDD